MKPVHILAGVASVVAALSVRAEEPSLSLVIEQVGNTAVKAALTNTAGRDLKLLRSGSILDDNLIERSQVFAAGEKVDSNGIHPIVEPSALEEENFQTLLVGETIELEWDVAEDHDLSSGGDFNITSSGIFSYAELDSTTPSGIIHYKSNVLEASINGDEAASMLTILADKRAAIQGDCQGGQRDQTRWALGWCRKMALHAEKVSRSGPADRMNFFFKSSDTATRKRVGDNFHKIAVECGSPVTGVSKVFCSDRHSFCRPEYIAYAYGTDIVNCPLFFRLPTNNKECRANTQATTMIHEASHLSQVMSASDYDGCYGITCIRGLSREQNLKHADTYSFFAQAASSGC